MYLLWTAISNWTRGKYLQCTIATVTLEGRSYENSIDDTCKENAYIWKIPYLMQSSIPDIIIRILETGLL